MFQEKPVQRNVHLPLLVPESSFWEPFGICWCCQPCGLFSELAGVQQFAQCCRCVPAAKSTVIQNQTHPQLSKGAEAEQAGGFPAFPQPVCALTESTWKPVPAWKVTGLSGIESFDLFQLFFPVAVRETSGGENFQKSYHVERLPGHALALLWAPLFSSITFWYSLGKIKRKQILYMCCVWNL